MLDSYIEIGDIQLQMGAQTLAHAAYQRALAQYRKIVENWPRDAHARTQAAAAYGQLAYLKLQFRRPREAVDSASQGLSLAPNQGWIAVNLVEAYVFSGQLAKAQEIFLKYRAVKIGEVSFKQALITDIQQLSDTGLNHPDVPNLRNWLAKN